MTMFTRTSFTIYCISLVLLTLGACASPQNTPGFLPVVPTPVVVATETSEIFTSVSIYTPVAISTPSVTLTPVSTLSKDDAYRLLKELLRDNGGCRLPCWWGITPNVSTPLDLHTRLTPLNSIADDHLLYANSGSFYITYFKNELFIDIDLSFQSDANNTVKMIQIFTQARRVIGNIDREGLYDAAAYKDLLGFYSLDKILSTYGIPTKVLVRADVYTYTQSPETFEITLLYPEYGIFVRYDTLAERIDGKIRGCPSKAFVELWLLSPNDRNSYQAILSTLGLNWEGNFPYSKSIEDAAKINNEEFFQVFKEPSNKCLETPLDIWPDH